MMKKTIIFVLSLVLLSFSVSAACPNGMSGDGLLESTACEIEDCTDLQSIGTGGTNCQLYYKLTQDISCSGSFTPLCSGTEFNKVFDGQGYKISGLSINSGGNTGLFSKSRYPAVFKNFKLENVNIIGSGYYVGSVVGTGGSDGVNYMNSIINVQVTGSVSASGANKNVGGLAGYLNVPYIYKSSFSGTVSGYQNVGGLLGTNANSGGTIEKSFSEGTVTVTDTGSNVAGGGLIGRLEGSSGTTTISNSYSTSTIICSDACGGLVGLSYGVTIDNCYVAGDMSGCNGNEGGIIGAKDNGALSISSTFWDTQETEQNSACGYDKTGLCAESGATEKTTSQMIDESTYPQPAWDFTNVWNIIDDSTYPWLRDVSEPFSVTEPSWPAEYDLTDTDGNVIGSHTGETTLQIRDGISGTDPKVEFNINDNVDLSGVAVDSDDYKTVVSGLDTASGVTGTHTLFTPDLGAGVYVCNGEDSLSSVTPSCTGVVRITHSGCDGVTSHSGFVCTDIGSQYKVTGLTGSGIGSACDECSDCDSGLYCELRSEESNYETCQTTTIETPQCVDCVDNDGDGKYDLNGDGINDLIGDPDCSSYEDDDETDEQQGGVVPEFSTVGIIFVLLAIALVVIVAVSKKKE